MANEISEFVAKHAEHPNIWCFTIVAEPSEWTGDIRWWMVRHPRRDNHSVSFIYEYTGDSKRDDIREWAAYGKDRRIITLENLEFWLDAGRVEGDW